MRKYFGTDGIRGNVGTTAIRPDFLVSLGHAVGRVLKERHNAPAVLIGKDTRVSGYMIESALEAGFTSAGVDVFMTGPLPTPGVAYLTRAMRLDLGVVISASHNPYHDNGIKFFSASGEKLDDAWERQVEAMMDQPAAWVESIGLGKARRLEDTQGRYIEFCKNTFEGDLRGKKIVVDAANGAAYKVATKVFHELGAEVHSIGVSPNGFNINDGCGATAPELIAKTVVELGADYGVALDGDADRIVMVDAEGTTYDGDQLLYIMAVHRKKQGYFMDGVVGTVMTNMGIEEALKRQDIELVRAKVGDRYILKELQARPGWLLGGESSGHVLVMDKHSTGDGIIAALMTLQALDGRTFKDALADAPLYAQVTRNIPFERGGTWGTPKFLEAIEKAETHLGDTGRVLVRPSGTEPVVRITIEAQDTREAAELVQLIEKHFGT